MSGRQTAVAPGDASARNGLNESAHGQDTSVNNLPTPRLSPRQLVRLLQTNAKTILALAAMLFALGVVVLLVIPARYTATALVLIDPREQKVTNEQDVLPGIGQDAAALQSIIEIAKSDGFLRPLIEKLNIA